MFMAQLIVLGTSSMVPTKDRNHSAFFFKYQEEGILIDCGEGTQRQLRIAGVKPSQITRVFISHLHGDHVFGLPGLLQTLSASSLYDRTLQLYGPVGIKNVVEKFLELFPFENNLKINIVEIEATENKHTVYKGRAFSIEAYLLDHRIDCFGFRFVEKDKRRMNMDALKKLSIPEGPLVGKLQDGESVKHNGKTVNPDEVSSIVRGKILAYIADTKVCNNCVKVAKNADLLICESTYAIKEKEKAESYNHLTTEQAASFAQSGEVKKLVLTHFSQRYKNVNDLLEEASDIFPNTVLAHDFMKIRV